MKKYKKIICMIAAVCLLGAAAFCGFRIYSHYAHESEQEEVFEKIAEVNGIDYQAWRHLLCRAKPRYRL